MLTKAIAWYKTLHPAWKVVAWVVVALAVLAAVAEQLVRVVVGIMGSVNRAGIDRSMRSISEARGEVKALEEERDRLLRHEAELGVQDAGLTEQIADMARRLAEARARVKEQTDDEQGDFFDNRFK